MPRTARAMGTIVTLIALLGARTAAQDSIRLQDGTRVTGDVVFESDLQVELVTAAAEMRTIPKSAITELRRGTPLDGRVAQWLAAADRGDAGALWAVTERAAREKSLAPDAKRLARRVVAVDPEHAGARALLGHAKAMGRWFPDAAAANRALAAKMKEDGLVPVQGGFARPSELDLVKAAPQDWMLDDDRRWLLVSEVMAGRGLVSWEKEWYAKTDAELLAELRTLKERTGEAAHAAAAGACRVFAVLPRAKTVEIAQKVHATREWFAKTFEVDPKDAVAKPAADFYVLSGQAALERFIVAYAGAIKLPPAQSKLGVTFGSVPYGGLSRVVHTQIDTWQHIVVSGLGAGLTVARWRAGVPLPEWLPIAIGHHAEIAILDAATVHFNAPDEYGRTSEAPDDGGRDIKGMKASLKAALAKPNGPSLRRLMSARLNDMTPDLDTLGVVFLLYLLEVKKPELLRFVKEGRGTQLEARFAEAFGGNYEVIERELHAWIGL
jgi:hypothetical protein